MVAYICVCVFACMCLGMCMCVKSRYVKEENMGDIWELGVGQVTVDKY